MRKYFLINWLFAALLAVGLWSCADIEGMSDANSIETFEIVDYAPSEVELGDVKMDGDKLFVPVRYGADKFPLTFSVEAAFDGAIGRVYGADLSKPMTVTSVEDIVEFYVQAQSGLPHKYTLSFQVVDCLLPDFIELDVKSTTPAKTPVFSVASVEDDVIYLNVIEPVYPLGIKPEFKCDADKVGFEGFDNGESMFVFAGENSSHKVKIVDKANNTKRDVKIMVREIELSDSEHESTDMDNTRFAAQFNTTGDLFEDYGFKIDNDNNRIGLYIKPVDAGFAFPVEAEFDLAPIDDNTVGFVNIKDGQTLTFRNYGDTYYYYAVDIQDKVARKWEIVLNQYKEHVEPQITNFTYTYAANAALGGGKCAVLDPDVVVIDNVNKEIWLKITESKPANKIGTIVTLDWRVNIGIAANSQYTFEVTEGATVVTPTIADSSPWNGFRWTGGQYDVDSWQEPIEFKVVAVDGTETTWTMNIRGYIGGEPEKSTECDLVSVAVSEILPLKTLVDPMTPIYVDGETIFVKLKDDENCYPLTVNLDCRVSNFATIDNTSFVFDTPEMEHHMKVTAEDGVTEKTYNVKLVRPVREMGANVRAFGINSFSTAFEWDNRTGIEVDKEAAVILITPERAGSCPTTIDYKMSLSVGAKASIANNGSFTMNNLNDVKTFTITASDGSEKEWTVKFAEFVPQLKNWQMEEWDATGSLTPKGSEKYPYWSNANNSFVKGTTKGVDNDGGSAPYMTTSVAARNMASGSVFLGWFPTSVSLAALIDPVKLTYQGIEFSASKKLIGVEMDVKYASGASMNDSGSIAMELIKHTDTSKPYEYHGIKPDKDLPYTEWQPHGDNTAVSVARASKIVSNVATTINGQASTVLTADEWTKVRLELDYSAMTDPFDFTHLLVIAASSAEGDIFRGAEGSVLAIDNVKLIYEE